MEEKDKLTMSVEETADKLGISLGLVYRLVKRNQLPACRLGGRIVIPKRVLEDFLSEAACGQGVTT